MSSHEKDTTVAAEMNATEGNDGTSICFSPDMIQERIKTNLEPLHAKILALTQMMDRLIQGNSASEFTTASTRETQFLSKSPFTDGRGSSRTPRIAPEATTGYSPDTF